MTTLIIEPVKFGHQRALRIAEALISNQVKHILYLSLTVNYALFISNKDIDKTSDWTERHR
jgi:hypothetical protein